MPGTILAVRAGYFPSLLGSRRCGTLDNFLQCATGNQFKAAKGCAALLRGLNELLRNVFPGCVVAAARQALTNSLKHDIHIGDSTLVQFCHGNTRKY
jgi:hypothetical protein